jgi:Fusaric acid resistance protein-like
MPTPAAGSELSTAVTTDRQVTLRRVSAGRSQGLLFNAGGAARRLQASPLLAIGPSRPGPALRRGFLLCVPIGAALLLELGLRAPTKGGIGTGALLAGFAGMDAPARARAGWQAATAPLIGLAAGLGAVTGESAVLAVAAMALVGAAAGYCFAVSLRLSIVGLMVALSLLIAQGLPLSAADAPEAVLFGAAGGVLQAVFSLFVWLVYDRAGDDDSSGWNGAAAVRDLAANLTLRSTSFRHALRFGIALAAAVGVYWVLGWQNHGFWVPLTVLFVLRPEEGETFHRLVLRAVGTLLGLVVATALAEWLRGYPVPIALALTLATAFSYGLLTVQYALFTAAITTYAVMLADTLGEPALEAAGQRAAATAIGIAIAAVAFLAWPNRSGTADVEIAPGEPAASPPEAASR